jgi:hypothetical protein
MEHTKSKVTVYVTDDYKRFRFVDGNRTTEDSKSRNKRKRIIDEINAGNDILDESPVLVTQVNSHLDIKDGQNRFLVAKELGRPIHYIIKKNDLSLYSLAKINSNTDGWSDDDYINCYVKDGNENYKKLSAFHKKYTISIGTCLVLLTFGAQKHDSSSQFLRSAFEQGKFEVKTYKEAVQFAELCKSFSAFSNWSGRPFIVAISRILQASLCDFGVLLKKFNKDPTKLTKQPNWKGYINNLELIYNYDNSKRRPII